MDRRSCWGWRRASTQAETGAGMVGEAAAKTTAATGVPGMVAGQQPGHGSYRGCCLTRQTSPSLSMGASLPPGPAIHLLRL